MVVPRPDGLQGLQEGGVGQRAAVVVVVVVVSDVAHSVE